MGLANARFYITIVISIVGFADRTVRRNGSISPRSKARPWWPTWTRWRIKPNHRGEILEPFSAAV